MPYNNIAMHKRANEQKTLIQNCSLLHPFNTVVSYMIHACFQATGEPTIQYLIYLDGPSRQEKNSQIFFLTRPLIAVMKGLTRYMIILRHRYSYFQKR